MNNEQGNGSTDSSEKVTPGPSSTSRVSSYTQVEPEYIDSDIRSIVGQEDIPQQNFSSTSQELSFKKQNKGVRPPLVGQASSSSNDSVSLEERSNDMENYERNVSSLEVGLVETVDHTGINFTRGCYVSAPFLLNREEYINQRPPEGSSDQVISNIQSHDGIQDCPRICSPSSASSVTSTKPLEWDSGADVGYNQIYSIHTQQVDHNMSPIELMALACGTNLLTRSDPEGTSGQNRKTPIFKNSGQVNQKYKYRLGFPNAESTPLATGIVNKSSPEVLSEGVISPINCENTDGIHSSSSSDINEQMQSGTANKIKNKNCPLTLKPEEVKIPLFPELLISSSNPSNNETIKVDGRTKCTSDNEYSEFQVKENKHNENSKSSNTIHDEQPDLCNRNGTLGFNTDLENKLLSLALEHDSNNTSKKFSSSLENVSITDNEPLDTKCNSNTIPRSQSQTNLHINDPPALNSKDRKNQQKYNMAFHSLVQYNKSASSSSVATVVQKKGDSPKHMFVQSSLLKKEPSGVQVCEGKDFYIKKSEVCFSNRFTETQNLPISGNLQNYSKTSNYFNFDTSKENHHQENNIHPQDNILEEYSNKTNDNVSHSTNSIPCYGAHKRLPQTEKNCKILLENYKQKKSSIDVNDNTRTNFISTLNGMVTKTDEVYNTNKSFSAVGTVESVESSAKSGGCWTDKLYFVTVEDRANSFEYLPGHVYENTERHVPLDSHETSSISIHNQISNNETPDEQTKSWDSTATTSSNLEKDVQKGVDIISEFLRGSCAQDSELKKKLIRRVVDKLVTKNYNDDKTEHIDLKSNVPWVPSQPPNMAERNGRETRRSTVRSKVPCEFSSRSEKSGSTNASSDCFIPKPSANSTFLPSGPKDSTCAGLPGQISNSSTSEISAEKKNHRKPPPPFDVKAHVANYGSISKNLTDSSNKPSRNSNWREPATKMEKLLEERKKNYHSESSNSQSEAMSLVQYLNLERENQLFWIRSEIQHLSNLKELLEKQEELRQGIKVYRSNKLGLQAKDNLKDKNKDRASRENGTSNKTEKSEVQKKTASPKSGKKYQPTLSAWLEKAAADSKTSTLMSSGVSSEGIDGWNSHQYSKDKILRSCIKRKTKSEHFKSDRKHFYEKENDRVIYDEPVMSSFKREANVLKQPRSSSAPFHSKHSYMDESVFITDEGITKKNAQTETLESVGVQTSDSVEQLPVVHPIWFKHKCGLKREEQIKGFQHECHCECQCGCKCCCEGKINSKEEVDKKTPVSYVITFEQSPSAKDLPVLEHQKDMPLPVVRRLRAGRDCKESGNETNTGSSENRGHRVPYIEKPTLPEATGLLQYYLLRNRPSYVSRAEDRRQCIAQMQYLRELREQSKRRLLSLTEPAEAPLPPPPMHGVRRVFSQQSMRRQTERKYRQLSEVQNRQQDTKRKAGYRTNRLMAEIFNKKLQKRVLKGEVNLSNSVSVISSIYVIIQLDFIIINVHFFT